MLIGAGLILRNMLRLQDTDPGFESAGVLTASLALPRAKYGGEADTVRFYRQLQQQAAALPGVVRAAAISHLPLSGRKYSGDFSIEGLPREPADDRFEALRLAISPGYFATMGIPLVEGRAFDQRDHAEAPLAIVIDETFASLFWEGRSPVGARVKFGDPDSADPWRTVVGVVRHVKQQGLDQESRIQMYLPHAQFGLREMTLVLRSAAGDPMSLAPSVRSAVLALDSDQPVSAFRTLDEVVSATLSRQRLSASLLTIFAAITAILAAVGVYGVLGSTVTERTQEIGIRMAVGAAGTDVLWLIVRQALRLCGFGLLVGLLAAVYFSSFLSSQLHDLSHLDPLTFAGSSLCVIVIALLATVLPAYRAIKTDPMNTLRAE